MAQTSYVLTFRVTGCSHSIQCNGFEISADKRGLQISSEYPLTQLLYNPLMEFNINLTPLSGEEFLSNDVGCEVVLYATPRKPTTELEQKIWEWSYVAPLEDNPVPSASLRHVVRPNDVADALKNWPDTEKLELGLDLARQLAQGYRSVWQKLHDKDIAGITSDIVLRERIYAESVGESFEEHLRETLMIYQSHVDNPDYELYGCTPLKYNPKIQLHGKVVSLEDSKGFHPIFFLKKVGRGSINIPLYFASVNNRLQVVL